MSPGTELTSRSGRRSAVVDRVVKTSLVGDVVVLDNGERWPKIVISRYWIETVPEPPAERS